MNPYRIIGKDDRREDISIDADEAQYRRWLIKEMDGKLSGANLERYIERKIAQYRNENKPYRI